MLGKIELFSLKSKSNLIKFFSMQLFYKICYLFIPIEKTTIEREICDNFRVKIININIKYNLALKIVKIEKLNKKERRDSMQSIHLVGCHKKAIDSFA